MHDNELIPAWLKAEDSYTPKKDKDRFINRTIVSLASLLSRALSPRALQNERSVILPEFKVVSLILVILLISLSRGFLFVSTLMALLLVILSLLDASDIIRTVKISFTASAFSFLVLLPSVPFYGFRLSLLISFKVLASVTAVNLVASTTRWDSIIRSVKILPIPDIFILVLDISLRYILLLAELSLEMFHALKLRSVGRNPDKRSSLAGISGSIFLSSRAMADEMYAAMTCRGFTGEYRARRGIRPRFADILFLLLNLGVLFFFFYCRRIS